MFDENPMVLWPLPVEEDGRLGDEEKVPVEREACLISVEREGKDFI